jgi:hypothetical protein
MKIPTPSAQTHVDLFDKDRQRIQAVKHIPQGFKRPVNTSGAEYDQVVCIPDDPCTILFCKITTFPDPVKQMQVQVCQKR